MTLAADLLRAFDPLALARVLSSAGRAAGRRKHELRRICALDRYCAGTLSITNKPRHASTVSASMLTCPPTPTWPQVSHAGSSKRPVAITQLSIGTSSSDIAGGFDAAAAQEPR